MYAKRFRLDHFGNLHADRLFCRLAATNVELEGQANQWLSLHRLEARAAKARAILAFEEAVDAGDMELAMDQAATIHVVMLAQRRTSLARKRRVAGGATNRQETARRPTKKVSQKC